MTFNPAVTHPATLQFTATPVFELSAMKFLQLQRLKREFESAGIKCSEAQLLSLTEDQIQYLDQACIYGLRQFKYALIEIPAEALCRFSGKLILCIAQYSNNIIEFIKSKGEFPWNSLDAYDENKIINIIKCSFALTKLKSIGFTFSWKELLSFNEEEFGLIYFHHDEYIKIYQAGIEFSREQFITLTRDQHSLIANMSDVWIKLKRHNIEFSWDQMVALNGTQAKMLKANAANLRALKKAQLDLTWNSLVEKEIPSEISIPVSHRKKTLKEVKESN